MDDIILIDNKKVDNLILEIYDYAEKIVKLSNQIVDLMDQTDTYLKYNGSTTINKKLIEMQNEIDTIKNNIESYATDLIEIKKRYMNKDERVAAEIDKKQFNNYSNYKEEVI